MMRTRLSMWVWSSVRVSLVMVMVMVIITLAINVNGGSIKVKNQSDSKEAQAYVEYTLAGGHAGFSQTLIINPGKNVSFPLPEGTNEIRLYGGFGIPTRSQLFVHEQIDASTTKCYDIWEEYGQNRYHEIQPCMLIRH